MAPPRRPRSEGTVPSHQLRPLRQQLGVPVAPESVSVRFGETGRWELSVLKDSVCVTLAVLEAGAPHPCRAPREAPGPIRSWGGR